MHYAQVRLFISSSLRMNDALFGCTSWNGYACAYLSTWIVQSPGVTNNRDEQIANHTLMYVTVNTIIFCSFCYSTRASFVALFVHRIMAHCQWLCAYIDPRTLVRNAACKHQPQHSRGVCWNFCLVFVFPKTRGKKRCERQNSECQISGRSYAFPLGCRSDEESRF